MKYILNFKVSIAIFLFITIQILISCAKIGSPSGGNYDRTPPKLLEANPKHNSTNYKGNEFEIKFDEYIVLANTSEEIIISPPLKNKPTIKSNLKTLSVSWTDTLSDNTTYIFDFGSSIVDYTEGNKLDKFSYSFSTGPYIDTNEYKGRLIEAYSQKPVSNKYVMLYKSEDSSIVSKQKPNYITRTDSNGNYHFRNIAKEKYLILALDDKNQNLLYDLSTEPIAFSNEMIEATIYSKDSIKNLQSNKTNILYYFEPKDTIINLNATTIISKYRFQLSFSNSTTDSLELNFVYPNFDSKEDSNIFIQYNTTKDTIDVWSLNLPFDSIKLVVRDIGLKEEVEQYYNKSENLSKKDTFSFITPNPNQKFYSNCLIEMPFPIQDSTQTIEALRIISTDTSIIQIKPLLSSPIFLQIIDPLEQGSTQKIIIPKGQIRNKLGQVNDSLIFNLIIDNESDYGNLLFTINDTSFQDNKYILVLEDLTGKEIMRKFSVSREKVEFKYLNEGNYKLRIIIDRNKNNKWDYGDYYNRILPEEIKYFSKTINIRKNWDVEEVFIP
ncbi:MAG: Ig-like domain-containing protein [Bacteroidales bacterium]|nr:Ig-like domain-containing protein [Bacteroidales bacterium]MEA5099418.1 Ig-like domain-containing protein [Bacteroidales bacterium]